MSVSPVVCNASPLIALDGIGHLELLEQLFSSIAIPPAVAREASTARPFPAWVHELPLAQAVDPQILRASLGPGEREAISLALELRAARTVLDDRPARRLAQAMGLPVIGTLGVLLACKRHGFIQSVRPLLEDLARFGFRMSQALYDRVLADAGEGP